MVVAWKRAGYRTLKHVGAPKVVVRFNKGVGKLKALTPDFISWPDRQKLLDEATAYWKQIGGGKRI
jgi:hypothetical protein